MDTAIRVFGDFSGRKPTLDTAIRVFGDFSGRNEGWDENFIRFAIIVRLIAEELYESTDLYQKECISCGVVS